MLNKIISFSVRNKLIIGLFVLALIGMGIFQVTKLPIDAVPDITDNQVQIITVTPALGAPDVERLITFQVEQACSNIPKLKKIRSFSRFGLSLVTLVFEEDVDVYWARQQASERLQKIQQAIPAGIGSPELAPVSTGLGEIYQYVVKAKPGFEKKYNATELRTIQDWVVRRQLLGVKGVADVSSFGGLLKQYEVAISTEKLNAYKISVSDVFSALEKNNQNTGGAYIEKGPTVLYIRTEGLTASIDDINNTVIKQNSNGLPLKIQDVAQVNIGSATRYGAMCYNAEGEVSGAVVMMLKGENSESVVKAIKDKVAQIQTILPEGVLIEPFLDRTKMVDNAIGTVEKNLIEGSLIVLFVLVIFLGNLRAGFLVASVIPLSMLFAIIMMNLFGVSGNLMSLGALDFGLIVDGAVIIVEAVLHRLSHVKTFGKKDLHDSNHIDAEVTSSATKMMNSAVFGQIIILIVYLPIFTLQGIEGKMFKPMAQTVAFALVGAFLLSLTYIPMMSALVLNSKTNKLSKWSDSKIMRLQHNFERYLRSALKVPKTILLSTFLLFVIAITLLLNMGGEFIPQLEEGDFAVDTRLMTGTNLTTTIQTTQSAADILIKRFPEVQKVVTKIGSGEIPTDPMPLEASDMMVVLKDKKEWTSAKTFPELAEKMSVALKDIPGISAGFQFPVQMRFNELMTGARQDVVCKIYGEDLDSLASLAARLGSICEHINGAKDIYVEKVTGMPQVVINYNRNIIAQYGLNVNMINDIVNMAFAGKSAGKVYEGERQFDLVVRLSKESRNRIEDIENLLVPLPTGNQIPLRQLAEVKSIIGPNQIQREDAHRRIIVGFNVRGRDVQSIVHELQEKVKSTIQFPSGYYINYGGAFENLTAAKERLSIAVPVSLILILIILFFALGKMKYSLLVYSAIPMSAIGGVLALTISGMPFSISAGIGFIALFGVAVLNGIVLMSEFISLKNSGMKNDIEIVVKGTLVRLRPVLMTACVASLGFLPMALSNGAGAEVQRPLATVVIGGLVSSTFLTLFVLPILYVFFENYRKRDSKSNATSSIVTASLIFVFLLAPFNLFAQNKLTLEQASKWVKESNLKISSEKLKLAYLDALKQTAVHFAPATITGEFGQVNSYYHDSKIGISQSFKLPHYYSNQKSILNYEAEIAQLDVQLSIKEVLLELGKAFQDYLYLSERVNYLKRLDSVYILFQERAKLRLDLGASSYLEKFSADNSRVQMFQQLNQAEIEKELVYLKIKWLLNTDSIFQPIGDLKLKFSPSNLENFIHPIVQKSQLERQLTTASIKAQKLNLFPEISLGYFNQSFSGWQKVNNVDQYFNPSNRFNSFQFGLNFNLLPFSQIKRISASRFQDQLAQNKILSESKQLDWSRQQSLKLFIMEDSLANYYERSLLINVPKMQDLTWNQFVQGDIDYFQFSQLLQQIYNIQNDYLDIIRKRNYSLLEFHSLTSN